MKKILCLLFLFLTLVGCSTNDIIKYDSKPIYALDTIISFSLYNYEGDTSKVYNDIKSLYQDYDSIVNIYDEDSEISKLNLNRSMEVSDELLNVIKASVLMMEKTGGYFNPLMGRLNMKWKDALKENSILDKDTIDEQLNIIKTSNIELDGNNVKIIGDAYIDVGGIAKGYITYLAEKYFKDNNIKYYLLNAGESSMSVGSKAEDNFRLAFNNPYSSGYYYVFEGINKSIGSSSGQYQSYLYDGKRYTHIINPFSGSPEFYYDSVNVICDNSLMADAYSTAVYSMNKDEAVEFSIKNNIDIILFKDDKIIYKSEGL